jgi:hypothetical protein
MQYNRAARRIKQQILRPTPHCDHRLTNSKLNRIRDRPTQLPLTHDNRCNSTSFDMWGNPTTRGFNFG